MWNWRRPDTTLVMQSDTDEDGTVWRAVRLYGDGSLAVLGHDIGPGVEEFFGCREYEFARTWSTAQTAALRRLLGLPRRGDLLAAVQGRFGSTDELSRFVEAHGITGTFWNRTGD